MATGHRVRPLVAGRFDSVDEVHPDRPGSVFHALEPHVVEEPVERGDSTVYLVHRPLRGARSKHEYRTRASRRHHLGHHPVLAFVLRPHRPRMLERMARLGDP